MKALLDAGKDFGWALALVLAIGALGFSWLAFNPVKEVVDHGVEPIGQSIGVLDTRCKDGWGYAEPKREGTTVSSPRCIKDGYVAHLDPIDRETCQYVMDTGTAAREGRGELTCEEAYK
jgi:hypothetical protein